MRRSRIVFALVGAAIVTDVAWAKNSCNGRFECSEITYTTVGTYHTNYAGTRECTYGHIEEAGSCSSPCTGTRTAPCVCKTRDEAEAAVVEDAKTQLYISIGVAVVGVGLLAFRMKERMKGQRAEDNEQADEPAPVEEAPPPQMVQAVVAQPVVVQATVVGVANPNQVVGGGVENNQVENNEALTRGQSSKSVMVADVVTRSASQLNVAAQQNPRKAGGMAGFVIVIFPLVMIGYWVYQITQSPKGVMGDFGLFLGLVSFICYVLALMMFFATTSQRMGLQEAMARFRSNPFLLFLRVQSSLCMFLPVVGIAGIAWTVNRMTSPEGVYSIC